MIILLGESRLTATQDNQAIEVHDVLCHDCQSIIGCFDNQEIAHLLMMANPILCFECEPPPDEPIAYIVGDGFI